jgi:Secretion system C-terminal sorting domain
MQEIFVSLCAIFQSFFNMNRFFILFFLLLLCGADISAQKKYELCNSVIGSTGQSSERGNLKFYYTVGEAVIITLKSNTQKLTQGFHQPDHCEFVSTGDLDLVALNIEVYPNPTEDRLSIRYDATKGGALYANVFDLLGRPVLSNHPLDRPDGASIECSAWQAGIYIIQLVDPETQASGTVRVVKL